MRIEYDLKRTDYEQMVIDLNRGWSRWRITLLYWLAVVGFLVFGSYLIDAWGSSDDPNFGYGAALQFIGCAYFLNLGTWTASRMARRHYQYVREDESYVADIDDARLEFAGPDYFTRIGWRLLTHHYETSGAINLNIGGILYMIPKRCCSAEQLVELRELLDLKHPVKGAG